MKNNQGYESLLSGLSQDMATIAFENVEPQEILELGLDIALDNIEGAILSPKTTCDIPFDFQGEDSDDRLSDVIVDLLVFSSQYLGYGKYTPTDILLMIDTAINMNTNLDTSLARNIACEYSRIVVLEKRGSVDDARKIDIRSTRAIHFMSQCITRKKMRMFSKLTDLPFKKIPTFHGIRSYALTAYLTHLANSSRQLGVYFNQEELTRDNVVN